MCRKAVFQFIFINILLNTFVKTQFPDTDECLTPSNAPGTCIYLKNCKVLESLLDIFPWSPSTLRLLRQSQCGLEGLHPKVCCPLVDTSYPYYRERPPIIDNHPNLRHLPTECGDALQNRIAGGAKTGIFDFPWMALLSYDMGGELRFSCAGSIINSRYILTSGNCLKSSARYRLVGVRVGEHDISTAVDCETGEPETVCAPPHQDIELDHIIPHPQFIGRRDYQHDIGLIRLKTPIDMTKENIAPICLPVTRDLQELRTGNLRMTVAGWGYTEAQTSSPDLLQASLPIVDNVKCAELYNSSAGIIGFRHMCAGGLMADSCAGDSGGPLFSVGKINGFIRFVQHGIVSFGRGLCNKENSFGVYTRVAFYMDWILDNLEP